MAGWPRFLARTDDAGKIIEEKQFARPEAVPLGEGWRSIDEIEGRAAPVPALAENVSETLQMVKDQAQQIRDINHELECERIYSAALNKVLDTVEAAMPEDLRPQLQEARAATRPAPPEPAAATDGPRTARTRGRPRKED